MCEIIYFIHLIEIRSGIIESQVWKILELSFSDFADTRYDVLVKKKKFVFVFDRYDEHINAGSA